VSFVGLVGVGIVGCHCEGEGSFECDCI
jgi:hypothetical protein